MYWSRVSVTWRRGVWPVVSAWPPPCHPEDRPLRRKKENNVAASEGKCQITYAFPRSAVTRILSGVFVMHDAASVLETRMSKI